MINIFVLLLACFYLKNSTQTMAITSFSGTLPMLTTNSNSILVLFIWLLLNVFTSDISPFLFIFYFIFQIHSLKRVRIGGFRLPSDLGWLSLTFFCFWEHSLSSSLSSFSLESKFSFCKSGRKNNQAYLPC
jgi:hypothetical protein